MNKSKVSKETRISRYGRNYGDVSPAALGFTQLETTEYGTNPWYIKVVNFADGSLDRKSTRIILDGSRGLVEVLGPQKLIDMKINEYLEMQKRSKK